MNHEHVAKILADAGFRSMEDVFEISHIDENGEPRFNFTEKAETFLQEMFKKDPTLYTRLFPEMLQ